MTESHCWARRLLPLALVTLSSLACQEINGPIYFKGPSPLLELQGTEKTPRITNAVRLRFRQPNSDEQKALDSEGAALKAADPTHRDIAVPWVSRDKVHLELLFTVKNLDTDPGTFDVLVDGANQYTKYDENVVAATLAQGNNDAAVYLPLLSLHPDLPMALDPGGVYQGTFREDDFDEADGDLDAIGRWMAPFASVLINRSDVNPIGLEMVPANVVTPALMEIDVTFTSSKHMTCEWLLRVRDDDDRLLHTDSDQQFSPTPTLFEPMLPPKT
jgi:hypothetical protein